MKNLILLFCVSISTLFFSQKIDSVGIMKESDMNKQFFSNKKRGIKVGEFHFADGNVIKVGDIVKIGEPGGIDYKISSTGQKKAAYDNIMLGTVEGSMLKGIRYADTSDVEDKEFKVEKIAARFGMGNATLSAVLIPHEHKLPVDKYITILSLNKGVKDGEVLLLNTKMTKDQAIKTLEEKKKLLDLGLITSEEFNKLRDELRPIILQ